MTKGMVEARISESVARFELNHMGRGPARIKTRIIEDMVIIRLVGFLTPAEKKMACDPSGIRTIKETRMLLFEHSIDEFKAIFDENLQVPILSVHSDISTVTGEKMIIVVFESQIENQFG